MNHLSSKTIFRSQNQSVVASAAYQSGEQLHSKKKNKTHDYTKRNGILYTEIITPENAPEWAKDREQLWNQVEARQENPLAREIQVALPRELEFEQNKELLREFIQTHFTNERIIADFAIHEDQGIVPGLHAHILLTTSEITSESFEKMNTTEWDMVKLCEGWTNDVNAHLEQAGFDDRIDHIVVSLKREEKK